MEINQIINEKYVGYWDDFASLPIKKGDIITIKKGTKYHSINGYQIAKKSYKIKVFDIDSGSQIPWNNQIISNPSIIWVGSGGYWHKADINDVI